VSEHFESRPDQEALRAELTEARAKVDGLVRELNVIDADLEDLAGEREQFGLVQQACTALEKLDELGGAALFWGDGADDVRGGARLGVVRQRVDEFESRIRQIEEARQALLDRIRDAQEDADILEDDVFEAQQQEELRKLEWVIEREMGPLPDTPPVMAWARGGEDDQRFRKSLAVALLISLLLALLIPVIPLPVRERWEVVEVSERFTRLIKEEPPPPPPLVQEQLPKEEELQEEVSEEEAPLVAEDKSTPEPKPEAKPEQSAGSKGILAFREKFSALAEARPSARLGAAARIDRSGEAAVGQRGRSMVTTQGAGSSGGIDLAAISRNVVGGGGGELEGVAVGKATSSIGGIAGPERPLAGGGPGPGRTDEEIQIVFDRHKAALYRLYNRELRRDPTLQGQIVLRLTIEPDGSVSLCEVQSSDMKAPNLSAQVAARVKGFDFGAKEGIPSITIVYPIDFLPAT
jgi:hypothetical protein